MAKRIATVLSVKESELTKDENKSVTDKNNKEMKLETVNGYRKLQILTLVPKSGSIRKAAKEFGVSKKLFKKLKS